MVDALKKVQSGDPLVIPAATYNTFIDAAQDYRQRTRRLGRQSTPDHRSADIVLVRNDSGADRDRFDVLGVDSAIVTPTGNLDAFKDRVALAGVTPLASQHTGRFVVLLEPLAASEIGRACASGVVQVRLNVQDDGTDYADVADGDATCLTTDPAGSATILWRETGTGTVWAVVRLSSTPQGTHASPKVLAGSGETADTESWDVDNQPAGCDGVQFTPMRLYWSGISGDPVYQFVRTPTYDSLGRLVSVSAEVRTVAFNTGPCQE